MDESHDAATLADLIEACERIVTYTLIAATFGQRKWGGLSGPPPAFQQDEAA
jgi:hypothetical protein